MKDQERYCLKKRGGCQKAVAEPGRASSELLSRPSHESSIMTATASTVSTQTWLPSALEGTGLKTGRRLQILDVRAYFTSLFLPQSLLQQLTP